MKTAKCGIGGQFSGVSRGRSVIYGNCPPVPLARSARYETAPSDARFAESPGAGSLQIGRNLPRNGPIYAETEGRNSASRLPSLPRSGSGIFISARLTLDKTRGSASLRRIASRQLFLNGIIRPSFVTLSNSGEEFARNPLPFLPSDGASQNRHLPGDHYLPHV